MTTLVVVTVIAAWVLVGLLTGLWMARRGHDPLWTLIAVALGPIFVPIALERVQRRPTLAASGPSGIPPRRSATPGGPRVLVGLDGSAESARALETTLRLFGSRCALIALAEVVHYEAAEDASRAELDAASERLAVLAADAEKVGSPVHTEVLAGPPAETLRQLAEQQDMDLLVVGRRGRGVSARLLGSVSADLVQHSSVPVLIVEPERTPEQPESAATTADNAAP